MSPDIPYVAKGGNDELTALYNRILAIERIKYLTGIDLREKSVEYKYLLDCELYLRFYKDLPPKPVDEEYCQRAAEVVRQFEKEKAEDLEKATQGATERVKQLYKESKTAVPLEPSGNDFEIKEVKLSLMQQIGLEFDRFIQLFKKKKV